MGLSAPKSRTKLSADPNNTNWSRNTDRFGHRILTSQGWTPGDYLGATDAAHADHYTSANASHIRVLLKEDNLGLGAKRGKEAAERFGLGGFEGVLGRLNGKDEKVLKAEEKKREDLEMKVFTSRRWGTMRFVSGGFLVGDKIERLVQGEKRKRGEEDGVSVEPEKKVRRKKGRENLAAAAVADASDEGVEAESKSKEKKEKKRRRQKEKNADETPSESAKATSKSADEKAEKKRRKVERRALKEARRLKKAERKVAESGSKSISATSTATPSRAQSSSSSEEDEAEEVKKPALPTTNPAFSMVGGRHAVRQRYIRQKKMASMDPRAMREIFMVKTGA